MMHKDTHYRTTRFMCGVMMFTAVLVLTATFYTAYLSPMKAVTIYVNRAGEADFEAIIFVPLMFIASLIGLMHPLREYIREENHDVQKEMDNR
jgi:hypothetical protein